MVDSWNPYEVEYFRHLRSLHRPSLLKRLGLKRRGSTSSRYDEARLSVIERSKARWYTGSEYAPIFLLMIEWQAFLTTVLSEAARGRIDEMDERDVIIWSLARLGNNTLHAVRHAFLDSVFPAVASGIRCLVEIIATIDFVKASDENLEAYIRSDEEGRDQVRIPFRRFLREMGERDRVPWLELYGEYSEYTHPKFSIVKTTLRSGPDSGGFGLAMYDEWHPEDLQRHWETTMLCIDRMATIIIAHFDLDQVLLLRLEQLVHERDAFKYVAE